MYRIFSVASQDSQPSGLAFNNDGTKMFVVGNTGDAVYEYNLTTAFDVSTASYVQNLSVSSKDTGPGGMTFNNDATKMFIIGHSSDNVFEYNLDNPAIQTVCINDAITNIVFNTTGATGIGTPTDLPTGLLPLGLLTYLPFRNTICCWNFCLQCTINWWLWNCCCYWNYYSTTNRKPSLYLWFGYLL